ncbi:hypothetical protein ACJMK2_036147 [Sinanodonta woodiana]|uniref:DH domain-containing protein n=1 Tax=Sinanodonta woodiana TaxID=1069815 RepID=A0ABD3WGJ2_SINWO
MSHVNHSGLSLRSSLMNSGGPLSSNNIVSKAVQDNNCGGQVGRNYNSCTCVGTTGSFNLMELEKKRGESNTADKSTGKRYSDGREGIGCSWESNLEDRSVRDSGYQSQESECNLSCFSLSSESCGPSRKLTSKEFNQKLDIFRSSMHWEDFFGSSVDLSPALLGIYDSLLCVNQTNREPEQNHQTTLTSQSEGPQFNRQIPHSAPLGNNRLSGSSYSNEKSCVYESEDEDNKNVCGPLFKQTGSIQRPEITVDWDNDPAEVSTAALMMETGYTQNLEVDSKKRPLSISSTSSSSTTSLPRSRKRPNLSDCADFRGSTGPSDIEKLDSLLYIDEGVSSSAETLDDDHLDGVMSKDGGDFGQSSAATCPAPEENSKSQGFNPPSSPPSSPIPVHGSDSSNCDSPEEASRTKVDKYSHDSTSKGSHGSFRARAASSSLKSSGHYVSYVQRVVAEIVDTERLYVQHLQDIKEGYLEYLVNNPSAGFTEEDRNWLFGNINNIYIFSRQFLGELEKCSYDPIKVADCFVLNNTGFVIYADYCTNYPVAVSVLTRVMHDQQLSEVFKQRQIALGHSLPLGAYLLKPVQRILKYHLLLQNILKHYKESEVGYEKLAQALKHMTSMAQHINEMKRKHEHAVRVQEIQSQLEDYRGEDFTCLGELVLEGSFRMYGAKASRQMFLFEKGVIIAKRKEDGMLSCKAFIPCATLMLVESLPREPLNFQILPFDNPRGAHTIHARNLEQKRKWYTHASILILESYKSKIPDKVKDLIMQQLGKSKEEENFVKAGNADSVKGHHATPDYLERRQRMRRKSGSNLIPEILRPQRTKKTQQQRSRDESISPRASPLVERALREAENSPGRSQNNSQAYHIYRTSEAQSRHHELQDHTSVAKKLPSVARSQSFQLATIKNPMNSLDLENPPSPLDKYLSNSDKVQRSHSFKTAVETRPVEIGSDFSDQCVVNMEKQFQENNENEQNIKNIVSSDNVETQKMVMINDKFGESNSLIRRGRYASMPVLNETQTSGRLASSTHHSEPRADRLSIEHDSLPLASPIQTRRIDLKPYFTVTKPQEHQGSPKSERPISGVINLSRDQSSVTAFHDKFSSVNKFCENLGARVLEEKITLTQPKPFSSTVKLYDSMFGSQAKLTKKNVGERFTKGSLVDLSHLKEDPWVRKSAKCRLPLKPDSKENHTGLLLIRRESDHKRTHSLSVEDTSFSRENLDWFVYATRNSLPMDRLNNRQYKYCTPPRGEMVPPTTCSPKSNTETLYVPPSYGKMESLYSINGDSAEDVSSSSSLSATTSSETCSSPDVLRDTLFDDSVPPRPNGTQSGKHLSRSNSSPETRHIFPTRRVEEDSRPASMDVHVRHLEDSDKLVAEMEDYIRNSSSSSSLSSTNKFPPTIPSFQPTKPGPKSKKSKIRHSYKSDDSLSSYDESEHPQQSPDDDTLVGTIKNKFHNITSKLKKAASPECEDEQSSQGKHVSNTKNTNLHHAYSLKARPDHDTQPGKKKDPDLTTLLREGEPGSKVIGSRMANPDFDDYADLSLPKTPIEKFHPTSDLPKEHPSSNFKEAESSELQFSLGSPNNSVNIQQSDSAFSIQSIDEDSSSPDGSPHQEVNMETSKPTAQKRDKEEEDSGETFYERRLSQALDDEEAFRDSAVYCDTDTDQPSLFPQDCPAPKMPIKRYVQMLEEKQKAKVPNTYKVKQREPGLIVRQRLESLLTSCEYNKNTSNSSSHSASHTTSRSTSCTTSRACSEERGNILDHFQLRNPSETGQSMLRQEGTDYKLVSKARTPSPNATMKSAYSLGRLDKISSDIENLVIMKGWVRQLISRFQTEH